MRIIHTTAIQPKHQIAHKTAKITKDDEPCEHSIAIDLAAVMSEIKLRQKAERNQPGLLKITITYL